MVLLYQFWLDICNGVGLGSNCSGIFLKLNQCFRIGADCFSSRISTVLFSYFKASVCRLPSSLRILSLPQRLAIVFEGWQSNFLFQAILHFWTTENGEFCLSLMTTVEDKLSFASFLIFQLRTWEEGMQGLTVLG